MAIYIYQNPQTGEIKEISQGVNDCHYYGENGLEWNRVFSIPQMSVDARINPLSKKQFKEKTINKKGTIGGLWDQAKELSKKREELLGFDPVKEKYYSEYKRKFKLTHPEQAKENAVKKLKAVGVDLT